jgi:hypothetical protein
MIGPKKLSTIRLELQNALGTTGADPIVWLEKLMASPEHQGAGKSEVLDSLRRFLEPKARKKRLSKRAGIKK